MDPISKGNMVGPDALTEHLHWALLEAEQHAHVAKAGELLRAHPKFRAGCELVGLDPDNLRGSPEFTMFPVIGSSNIMAIGYHNESRELRVQFKGGKTYAYADVPPETHMSLMTSESKGGFFHREIRGRFETSTVKG